MKVKQLTFPDGSVAYASEGIEIEVNKQKPVKIVIEEMGEKDHARKMIGRMRKHDKKPKQK